MCWAQKGSLLKPFKGAQPDAKHESVLFISSDSDRAIGSDAATSRLDDDAP